VLGRYFDTLMVYTNDDDFDAEAAVRFIQENGIDFRVLVARDRIFDRLGAHMKFSEARRVYLCELTKKDFQPAGTGIHTEVARKEDSGDIYALRCTIEEFKGFDLSFEAMRGVVEQGRTVIVREDGNIVSLAMCGAVTGKHANIGGVCTARLSRGRGYASQAVSDLSAMLLEEGFICSLTYNNPAAGAIYHRLGYRKIGEMVLALR